MFHATKNRMAASAASGTCAASGASSRITSSRNTACTTPASGLVAPLRMLVAVRAMAPVAAKPPNSGAMMLAAPWPMSSWFESWRAPVMPSATTAVSSDSMAPNKAMANAGPTSCSRSRQRQRRPARTRAARAECRRTRCRWWRRRRNCPYACTPVATSMATQRRRHALEAGHPREPAIARDEDGERQRGDQRGGRDAGREARAAAARNFSWKCRPEAAGCRPKKSFHWPDPDDHGDAGGEADDHRARE